MVSRWTISTSRTWGARRIKASTRVSGSAQPGWTYTRIPDCTQRSASSGVRNFSLYSVRQDMTCLSILHGFTGGGGHCRLLIPQRGVKNRPVEELFQQLQHLQFPEDFYWTVQGRLFAEKLPQIFFGKNNDHHELAEGHALLRPARADLQVALLDIEFGFPQQ